MNKSLIALGILAFVLGASGCGSSSDSDSADSGNGDISNGDTGNGDTDNGDTGNGDTGNGDTGNGDTGNGDTGNGDTDNGDTDNGDTDNGNGDPTVNLEPTDGVWLGGSGSSSDGDDAEFAIVTIGDRMFGFTVDGLEEGTFNDFGFGAVVTFDPDNGDFGFGPNPALGFNSELDTDAGIFTEREDFEVFGTLGEQDTLTVTADFGADGSETFSEMEYSDFLEKETTLSDFEGVYRTRDGVVPNISLNVDADGSFNGQSFPICNYTGSIEQPASGANAYNIELTLSGGGCLAEGTIEGIASLSEPDDDFGAGLFILAHNEEFGMFDFLPRSQ